MTITTDEILNKKIGGLYLHYFIPTICGTLMGCVYGFADVLFIGRGVGGTALAALNIATPIYSIFGTLATLFGVGGAVTLSICLGQGKRKEGNQVFSLSIALLALLSVVIVTLGQCFLEPIALFFGATPEILDMVKVYMGTVLWGTPGFLLNWALSAFVRNDGNPKLVMWASVVPNMFNVVFDYVFVFHMQMGIFGAALATALSPILGLMIISMHFVMKRNTIAFVNPLHGLSKLGRMLKNGCGYAILEGSNGVLIFSFNLILIQLGSEMAVSAYAVLLNVGWLIYSLMQGFVQAAQPIISVNYGAGKNPPVPPRFLPLRRVGDAVCHRHHGAAAHRSFPCDPAVYRRGRGPGAADHPERKTILYRADLHGDQCHRPGSGAGLRTVPPLPGDLSGQKPGVPPGGTFPAVRPVRAGWLLVGHHLWRGGHPGLLRPHLPADVTGF